MYKACSRCGKIHDTNFICKVNKPKYSYDSEEAKLRNTHKWHMKADEIKERSKYLCAVCYDEGRYNYRQLEVHHIEKLRDNPDRLLDDTNLICLCRDHHRLADAGMIDQDYLYRLAELRDMPPEGNVKR